MLEFMRVLVIEDDHKIASFVVNGLKQSGYAVDRAADGEAGLIQAQSLSYDAAIVDLMLPKQDGLSVIQELRAKGSVLPVLILSAKASVDDRVRGLQAGGDDYLTKPFAFSELLARIRSVLRRGVERQPDIIRVADLEVHLTRRQVVRAGIPLRELRSKEFALLALLARRAGEVLSRTTIVEHVWNADFDFETNAVDVQIKRLREKVDDPFERKLIHTVRGVGYVLEDRG